MPRRAQLSKKVRARQHMTVPMARGHGLKKGLLIVHVGPVGPVGGSAAGENGKVVFINDETKRRQYILPSTILVVKAVKNETGR